MFREQTLRKQALA